MFFRSLFLSFAGSTCRVKVHGGSRLKETNALLRDLFKRLIVSICRALSRVLLQKIMRDSHGVAADGVSSSPDGQTADMLRTLSLLCLHVLFRLSSDQYRASFLRLSPPGFAPSRHTHVHRALLRDAEEFIGGGAKVKRAVVAVPAYFTPVSAANCRCNS